MTKTSKKKQPVKSKGSEEIADDRLILLADLIIDTFLAMQRNKTVDFERRNVIKFKGTQQTEWLF